jgi:RNA polymerase sigma-70 factor (ECF subfamily)
VRDGEWLASQFEQQRGRLRALAYRMLGSLSEADDAVQDTWLRLNRADADGIENLPGWLTTALARVCLNTLRSRETRREDELDVHVPDPLVADPEREAVLADSVGWAMLVILESLAPAERVAFVLHDMFSVPFEEIAPLLDRTPAATRQLASRARRRVDESPVPEPDVARQREVVDAFFAASREGDLGALLALLDPDVLLRSDGGPSRPRLSFVLKGSAAVAGQALASGGLSPYVHRAVINGTAGVAVVANGRPLFVMVFTVAGKKIIAVDVLADPDRLARLKLSF